MVTKLVTKLVSELNTCNTEFYYQYLSLIDCRMSELVSELVTKLSDLRGNLGGDLRGNLGGTLLLYNQQSY